MKSSPKVSVIMNCYNSDRFLSQAIDSVFSQTYENWEIIFWDNASTDDSAQIAQSYSPDKLHYFRAEKNTSLGLARNLAMKRATGKYIAFLDCDDEYLPDKLSKQVQVMEEGGYRFCYGSALVIDELGRLIRRHKVKYRSGYIFDKLLRRYEINMQTVMLEKSLLHEMDLQFEPKLRYSPDYDLFMRVASFMPCGVVNEYLAKYRVCDNSLSKKTLHLVSDEQNFTLGNIVEKNPNLLNKLRGDFEFAFAKLHYYDAINLLSEGDFSQARKELRQILFKSPKFVALYILLVFSVPRKAILSLLRR